MDDSSPNADGSPQASERSSSRFDDDMDLDSDSEEREKASLSLERRSVSPELMEESTPYLPNALDENDSDRVPFEKHTHDTGDDDGKLKTFYMYTDFFSKWLTLKEICKSPQDQDPSLPPKVSKT
ncbi:hypothetical protein QFC21_006944 [Naganishia friedmannii]|uniref:Uncharacterized protein n=1 Tax=Naganishia friedmannii TaxID=89922 RepID=A0ACC2UYQ2_9TREE|nr:hypothetical protein QFC21_006944 [Naganishia friedmannii]